MKSEPGLADMGGIARMFVRGLQASYNQVSARTGYKVPFGSMIVFGLSCGQIMFAFLLSPSTIPPEYNSWYVHDFRGLAVLSADLWMKQDSIGFSSTEECCKGQ